VHVTTLVPADEHVEPHAPQLLMLVIAVSQPLFGFESQLPCVESHVGEQPPVEPLNVHVVDPLALVHAVEHAPQFDVVVSDTRQPLAGLPPHTPCVESHVGAQPPVVPLNVHDVAVVLVLAHTVVQPPQLEVVVSDVSQPLSGFESQLPCVESQLGEQPPVVPLNVHVVEPPPLVHAVEHAPQFDVVVSDVSQPLFGFESQLPCVESHVGEQPPVEPLNVHVVEPLALVQAVPHAPQWLTVVMSVSHPFDGSPSQSACVESQVSTHEPLHVPLMPMQHVAPHTTALFLSV
jgi:hypothetical protein